MVSVEPKLTKRQQEILTLLAAGHQNKVIAKQLSLTESTVKRHIYNIYEKLGVKNRIEAINKIQLR